jgi:catechol 2,3-dioxygenase-like lactoylglutathione lyase family enzyme
MAETSPAKVKVSEIRQVAIVVKDLQMVAKNYWDILGIGPWDVHEWEAPLVYDRTYHGKPAWAREKIALAQVGTLQLELVQPVEGDSIYQDFLIEHGEGLHHMNFLVDDLDETAEILSKQGFPSLQSAHRGPREHKGGYNYIDIKPLRAIWEPVHRGIGTGVEPTRYPDTMQESPAKVKVSNIAQIAIVVKDVQVVAENYWNILGIGPWDIYEWEASLVYDRTYHAKPAWARERIALAQVGALQLELVQPVEGDSIYQDFLMEHGERLHHLKFVVDNVDETADILAKQGFPNLQGGHVGSPEYNAAYAYIDIKPLRAIWELSSISKDKGLKDMGIKSSHSP